MIQESTVRLEFTIANVESTSKTVRKLEANVPWLGVAFNSTREHKGGVEEIFIYGFTSCLHF